MLAFSAAVNAIFADPNMAVDAIYRPRFGGAGVACRVILTKPDVLNDFGGATVVSGTLRVDIRASDVPAPEEGARIVMGTDTVVIHGDPVRDRLGLVWQCGTLPEDQACD